MIETGLATTNPEATKDIERIHCNLENCVNVLSDKVNSIEEFLSRTTNCGATPREVANQPESAGSLGALVNLTNRFDELNGRLIDAVSALENIG